MLTAEDIPTIENAINRRLKLEPNVHVWDVICTPTRGAILVRVELEVGGSLDVESQFDLPDPFEHAHLLDEIDQIAEHCKQANKQYWLNGRIMAGRHTLTGTGLRGGWKRYG